MKHSVILFVIKLSHYFAYWTLALRTMHKIVKMATTCPSIRRSLHIFACTSLRMLLYVGKLCNVDFFSAKSRNVINKIQSTLKRLYRFGYTAQLISLGDIVKSCSVDVFHNMRKCNHCLHELLSSYSQRSDSLRARGHDCVLPVCSSNLHKQSFLVRRFLILYS